VSMSPEDRAFRVRALAKDHGFDRCGIARAKAIGRGDYLREWLDTGRAGTMAYMHRYFDQRVDPRRLLDGAISVVVVALLYHREQPARPPDTPDNPRGLVARYAWGDDYHGVVKKKLHAMADAMRTEFDEPFTAKACVDTAPLLEREWAASAGIGWIGKNTMSLSSELGSYFVLGALVTTLDLATDTPVEDRCGSCTRCLDACPTGALVAPYQMDASRCISYLTIERREAICETIHKAMGRWVFGCDICQEVCPYNREGRAPIAEEPRFAVRPPAPNPDLSDILSWTEQDYREHLSGSAMKRATLDMLKRNARIALANT